MVQAVISATNHTIDCTIAASIFLLNMTLAPTTIQRIASKPVVKLQTWFNLSSALAAFFWPFSFANCLVDYICAAAFDKLGLHCARHALLKSAQVMPAVCLCITSYFIRFVELGGQLGLWILSNRRRLLSYGTAIWVSLGPEDV